MDCQEWDASGKQRAPVKTGCRKSARRLINGGQELSGVRCNLNCVCVRNIARMYQSVAHRSGENVTKRGLGCADSTVTTIRFALDVRRISLCALCGALHRSGFLPKVRFVVRCSL